MLILISKNVSQILKRLVHIKIFELHVKTGVGFIVGWTD